jgi:hypothetical protein
MGDLAILHLQRSGIDAPLASGQSDEHRSPGGACLADRRNGLRGGLAAHGHAVIGHEAGVAHDEIDLGGGNAQFLGRGGRDFGPRTLAHFDLAGHDGDDAVLADMDARADVDRPATSTATAAAPATATAAPTRAAALLLGRDQWCANGDDQPRPQHLQKIAAGSLRIQ